MKKYILNPAYHLRKEGNRVLLYTAQPGVDKACPEDFWAFIHPLNARMLSFFNGEDAFDTVVEKAAGYLGLPCEDMAEILRKYIENEQPLRIGKGAQSMVFPPYMVIEKKAGLDYRVYSPADFSYSGPVDLACKRLTVPESILLELTMQCYTDCVYCYANRKMRLNAPLPTERILALIREAKAWGVEDFDINGGEILLHPAYREVLAELKSQGYDPYVSTKIPLEDDVIRSLQDMGIQTIQISLDSVSVPTLRAHLQVKEAYKNRMDRALRRLEKAQMKVIVNSIVTSYNSNLAELKELIDYVAGFKNIGEITFTNATFSIYKTKENFARLNVSESFVNEFEAYLETIKNDYPCLKITARFYNRKSEFRNGELFGRRGYCSGNLTSMVILPDGRVTVCEELYDHPRFRIGDVSTQSLQEVWNSQKARSLYSLRQEMFSEASPCRSCKEFATCRVEKGVCWKEVLAAYGPEKWDFPDPRCPKAPVLRHDIYMTSTICTGNRKSEE